MKQFREALIFCLSMAAIFTLPSLMDGCGQPAYAQGVVKKDGQNLQVPGLPVYQMRIADATPGQCLVIDPHSYVVGSSLCGGPTAAATLMTANGMVDLGDSTEYGQAALTIGYSAPAWLTRDHAGRWDHFALGGSFSYDIGAIAWHTWNPTDGFNLPLVYLQGGVNDAECTFQTGPCSVTNFTLATAFHVFHYAMPLANQTMVSNCTHTGTTSPITSIGTWTMPTSSLGGTGLSTSTSAVITCQINSTPTGHVALFWLAADANTGTFTVTNNGVAQTSTCSGTTTFTTAGCGHIISRNASQSGFAQELTGGVKTGNNTIVITITGSAGIVAVGTFPSDLTNVPVIALQGIQKFAADADSSQTLAMHNAAKGIYNALIAAGDTKVFFVDPRAGIPGINTTTDYACTSVIQCTGGDNAYHLSRLGYYHMAMTAENAAIAAGFVGLFIPNAGVDSGISRSPLTNGMTQPVSDFSADLLVNPSVFNNTGNSPGINCLGSLIDRATFSNCRMSFMAISKLNNIAGYVAGATWNCIGAAPTVDGTQTSCHFLVIDGGLGAHYDQAFHFGSRGPLSVLASGKASTDGPGVSWDSQVVLSGTSLISNQGADTQYLDTSAGPMSIVLPDCNGTTTNNIINYRILYIKQSSDTHSISFYPSTGGATSDTLNGSSSAKTFSIVAPWSMFIAQCSVVTSTASTWSLAYIPGS